MKNFGAYVITLQKLSWPRQACCNNSKNETQGEVKLLCFFNTSFVADVPLGYEVKMSGQLMRIFSVSQASMYFYLLEV